jgi:hypothetical protein
MKVLDILNRAQACCDRIPARTISQQTLRDYRRAFVRMWRERVLDALRPGDARDTYLHRRAALYAVSWLWLTRLRARCFAAADRNDIAAVQHWAAILKRVLDRVEPALALDPPLAPNVSPWDAPPSRWHEAAGPHPRRGKNSKKHVLPDLPSDWLERLWEAVPEVWPYRAALAVHMTTPCRPEELVPGPRPHGWSAGVILQLHSAHELAITFAPVKTRRGKYGTPSVTIRWDPTKAGAPAAYLGGLCAAAGGRLVVSLRSKNAMRKSLGRLGARALPEVNVVITPYVLRNQLIADLKATVGAGGEVAAAAGHCIDRTQAKYGRVAHGRKRKGYLGVTSAGKPSAGNVARAHTLAAARRPRESTDIPPDEGSGPAL